MLRVGEDCEVASPCEVGGPWLDGSEGRDADCRGDAGEVVATLGELFEVVVAVIEVEEEALLKTDEI